MPNVVLVLNSTRQVASRSCFSRQAVIQSHSIMIGFTATVLCLAVASVTGFDQGALSMCPDIQGDPTFNFTAVFNSPKWVAATSRKQDADSDRCVFFNDGLYTITGYDSSLTFLKFTNVDSGPGTFTQIGSDGNISRGIVLKTLEENCGHLSIAVRCSDTVVDHNAELVVRVRSDPSVYVSDECLAEAAAISESILGFKVNFYRIQNSDCLTSEDVCPT